MGGTEVRAGGGKPAARAYDASIAAPALAENVSDLYLRSCSFRRIEGLDVCSVPHPDSGVPLAVWSTRQEERLVEPWRDGQPTRSSSGTTPLRAGAL